MDALARLRIEFDPDRIFDVVAVLSLGIEIRYSSVIAKFLARGARLGHAE